MNPSRLRIGTRGSPLAVKQASEVAAAIMKTSPGIKCEIVKIVTTGDRELKKPLTEIGGKGLFTKEIEEALESGSIDLAVHSMKDMPAQLPDGLVIGAVPERQDPRDALICMDVISIEELPHGVVVGTASVRRQAQLMARRPDLEYVVLRGNVGSRLRKIENQEVFATILAMAGLNRLGRVNEWVTPLSPEVMLPAIGQGALAVECVEKNDAVRSILSAIQHSPSACCIEAERAFQAVLSGSCRTPIAGYATLENDTLQLKGLVAATDGTSLHVGERKGSLKDAAGLGEDLGKELKPFLIA